MHTFIRGGGDSDRGRRRRFGPSGLGARRLGNDRSPEGVVSPPPVGRGSREASLLIVEDDYSMLSMLELGLAAEGLKPIWTATTGELALKVLVTHHPDYVLLDYQLPRMSGETVGMAVRRLLPRTKVIVYSGTVSQTLEWADAYLLKPDIEGVLQYFRDQLEL